MKMVLNNELKLHIMIIIVFMMKMWTVAVLIMDIND